LGILTVGVCAGVLGATSLGARNLGRQLQLRKRERSERDT
jgi:hypothetical protein